MYKKAYGIIQTQSPLHVGATAGEETGNLNLIFRDQFTHTGIIPGSSIRGRLRSEMRRESAADENHWYGKKPDWKDPEASQEKESDTDGDNPAEGKTTESFVKIEYASIVWLPVFCPGQPIVWVTCPRLLRRYQRIAGDSVKLPDGTLLRDAELPDKYTRSQVLEPLEVDGEEKLFFNFGFLTLANRDDDEDPVDLSPWFPLGEELPAVVVADDEIAMIHDMALYRQSRVRLEDEEKKVKGGQFFNTEALPEDTILVFAIALRDDPDGGKWQPFNGKDTDEIYLGGLESIGFGRCSVTLKGV